GQVSLCLKSAYLTEMRKGGHRCSPAPHDVYARGVECVVGPDRWGDHDSVDQAVEDRPSAIEGQPVPRCPQCPRPAHELADGGHLPIGDETTPGRVDLGVKVLASCQEHAPIDDLVNVEVS